MEVEEKAALPFGVDEYIGFAESLKKRCQRLKNVQGIGKLERKIQAEIKFLISLKRRHRDIHTSHLQSSNMCHFASIVHAAENVPGVVSVLHPFRTPVRGPGSLVVDVVAGHGYHWVKVIARKGQALHLVWAGQGQFGERDLVAQAKDYKAATENNLHHFSQPQVHLVFYNQVTRPMAEALASLDIHAWGQTVPVDEDVMLKLTSVLALDDTVDNDDDDDLDYYCYGCENEEKDEEDNENSANLLEQGINGDCCGINPSEKSDSEKCICNLGNSFSSLSVALVASQSHSSPRCTDNSADADSQVKSAHVSTDNVPVDCCKEPVKESNHVNLSKIESEISLEPDTAHQPISTCSLSSNSQSEATSATATSTADGIVKDINVTGQESFPAEEPEATCPVPRNEDDPHNANFDPGLIHNCYFHTSMHPHDSLFRHIVISPPDFRNFPSPSDRTQSPDCSDTGHGLEPYSHSYPKKVNLDITSLITLVSNVTHGHCHFIFKDKVLALQAEEERAYPSLPALEKYLEGKELFACQTAVSSFQSILDILGGQQEKEKAAQLMARVTVVQDQLSPRAEALENQGKIKVRSKVVFGTGDFLQAVTATSNSGFVRAARHQGVNFSVFLHPARALTEQKEHSATIL